jgi:uncharacterized protein (TIGR02145 family)
LRLNFSPTKIAQAATLGFALIFTTISCDNANNPSALVGRWIGVSGEDKNAVMELLGDGTGIVTRVIRGSDEGVAITWKTEKERFYITVSGAANAAGYKLQGSLLTFTEDNGKVSEYTKCHKDCKEAARDLPSDDEWWTLVYFAGCNIAGKMLNASNGWNNKGNGENVFGFSALPGGYGERVKMRMASAKAPPKVRAKGQIYKSFTKCAVILI